MVGGALVRALALELAGHGFDPNWWHAAELVLIVSTTLLVVSDCAHESPAQLTKCNWLVVNASHGKLATLMDMLAS